VDEILAAVLHSIRENYLTKVQSGEKSAGKYFFQGATAKNKALVAAFEQKLKVPIMVSEYCHLTGALGVALELSDKELSVSKFRGLDLYKKSILSVQKFANYAPTIASSRLQISMARLKPVVFCATATTR